MSHYKSLDVGPPQLNNYTLSRDHHTVVLRGSQGNQWKQTISDIYRKTNQNLS